MRFILVLLVFLPLIYTATDNSGEVVLQPESGEVATLQDETQPEESTSNVDQTAQAAPAEEAVISTEVYPAEPDQTTPETDQSPQVPVPVEEAQVPAIEETPVAPTTTQEATVVPVEEAQVPVVEAPVEEAVIEQPATAESPVETAVYEAPVEEAIVAQPEPEQPEEPTPEETEPTPAPITPIDDAEAQPEPEPEPEKPKQRVRVWNRAPKSEADSSARYGGLIIPNVRVDSTLDASTDQICGGTTRAKASFVTSQNFGSQFKWYIETPKDDATCQFRITDNLDQNDDSAYVTLIPKNRKDVNADGSFPCGRTTGLESATFNIPSSIDADACVLEWIWRSGDSIIRECADIAVVSENSVSCLGKCENGGICHNGHCVCPKGYSGEYCNSGFGMVTYIFKKILLIIFFILVILVLILLIIMLLYCCAQRKIKNSEKEQIYHTNKKYAEFDREDQTVAAAGTTSDNLRRADTDNA